MSFSLGLALVRVRRSDGYMLVLSAVCAEYLHVIMETKGGKKSKKSSIQYESPLGYVIEDVRPHGGSEKFRTAAYSNVSVVNCFVF